MDYKKSLKIAASITAILTISACGGSNNTPGSNNNHPTNGTININYTWPSNSQNKSNSYECTTCKDGACNLNYDTGQLSITDEANIGTKSIEDSNHIDGIPQDKISDVIKLIPASDKESGIPTGEKITIKTIAPVQVKCGTQTGIWKTQSFNLKNGETKTITLTFTTSGDNTLHFFTPNKNRHLNTRLGSGKAG